MTRVLVVDDEPGIRSLLRRSLERLGAEVACASNGEEALDRLAQSWDLVFTDIAMPGKSDGVEVLRRARETGAPVVVMTGYPDLGSTLAAMRTGVEDYLLKPFSVEQIGETFRRVIRGGSGQAPSAGGAPSGLRAAPTPAATSRVATALFADIRGFSAYAASVPALETGAAMEELLPPVMAAVRSAGGAIQQVLGDGFLALFGGPAERGAVAAVRAGLAARAAAAAIFDRREREGRVPLAMGFGLDTGEVVVQTLGGAERPHPVFLGHAVNVAARLEKAAPAGAVLVGPGAAPLVRGLFNLYPLSPLRLHGFQGDVPICEVVPAGAAPRSAQAATAAFSRSARS